MDTVRTLDFGSCKDAESGKKVPTWADRVRGVPCEGGGESDGEGWETVTRGRKASPASGKGSSRPTSGREGGRRQNSVSSQISTPVTEVPETTPTGSAQVYPEANEDSEEAPDVHSGHEIDEVTYHKSSFYASHQLDCSVVGHAPSSDHTPSSNHTCTSDSLDVGRCCC